MRLSLCVGVHCGSGFVDALDTELDGLGVGQVRKLEVDRVRMVWGGGLPAVMVL